MPATTDNEVLTAWNALYNMLGVNHLDAGLHGLMAFLQSNREADATSRVCFTADCEVGFEVDHGMLCIDPHDEPPVCCSSEGMLVELEKLIDEYDARYA
ncbi:MAG: hypothetical protein GYB68_14970 [Chloroflexi bacterium]|nr:hypothetical protein [Chloroflexota bacterium]